MSKGFTLLELLIVIAILAILTTVVVLILNPAEYLAQARDSQRLSDTNTLNSAISLYLATVSNIVWTGCGSVVCTATGTVPGGTAACGSVSSSTVISGGGWVPISFNNIPGGSPLIREPIDPTNNSTYKYAYNCNASANTYEIDAKMESAKYRNTGASDVESKDGGNASSTYEIGTALDLIN